MSIRNQTHRVRLSDTPKKKSIRFSISIDIPSHELSTCKALYPTGIVFEAIPHVIFSVIAPQTIAVHIENISANDMDISVDNNGEACKITLNFIIHHKE